MPLHLKIAPLQGLSAAMTAYDPEPTDQAQDLLRWRNKYFFTLQITKRTFIIAIIGAIAAHCMISAPLTLSNI